MSTPRQLDNDSSDEERRMMRREIRHRRIVITVLAVVAAALGGWGLAGMVRLGAAPVPQPVSGPWMLHAAAGMGAGLIAFVAAFVHVATVTQDAGWRALDQPRRRTD